jgi:hypothetical protein
MNARGAPADVPEGVTEHTVDLEACLAGVVRAIDFGPTSKPQTVRLQMKAR